MNNATKVRMQAKIASLLGNDPTLCAIQENVARLKDADSAIGWNVEQGQHRLVRAVYDERGVSTVTPIAGPLPAPAFLAHVEGL
jgi:hypothetical protein